MLRTQLRDSLAHIGQALREPEAFAVRWHREGAPYNWMVFAALACTAIAGTTLYGMTIGLPGGVPGMARGGLYCTVAAGIAWSLPLPALYVLNSLAGSRLRPSTTLLAAQVTTSWGGLALLAAIPVAWFFTMALNPFPTIVLLVHLAIFSIVGIAMIDVFSRVMERL